MVLVQKLMSQIQNSSVCGDREEGEEDLHRSLGI